jgi:3-oxoacyl-[acyl-carrier protein] reductase
MNLKAKIKRLLMQIADIFRKKEITYLSIKHVEPTKLLENRVALITGGGSGIGKAIAKSFAESGAIVIIAGRNEEKLIKAKKEIGGGNVYTLQLDTTDIPCLSNKIKEAEQLLGGRTIDILINNAGVSGGEISTTNEIEFDKIINTNIKGTFFMSKYFGEYMRDRGIKGNILNIASSSSLRPATSAYNISKWGIRGFTIGLARLLAPHGITVNGIAPGPTATPMMMKNNEKNMAKPNSLIKRWILPEEIANMAVFLVSDMGKSIVGDIVYMTGGAGNVSNEDISYNF